MEKTRAYRRYLRHRAIARKLGIIQRTNCWYIENGYEGKLAKGKIHCSCAMCSPKVNMKSKNRKRGSGEKILGNEILYKVSEERKLQHLYSEGFKNENIYGPCDD